MNDLVYLMKNCNISTYADNTQIFAAETEPDKLQEMINTDLAAIERWYDTNGMEPPLKISSNGYGQLTNSETKVPLRHCDTATLRHCDTATLRHCDNTTIPVSEDLTLLGVTIDNKLNFDKQIANVTRKVSQQLAVLKTFEKHSTSI